MVTDVLGFGPQNVVLLRGVALRVALPANVKIVMSRKVCSREALTGLIDPSIIISSVYQIFQHCCLRSLSLVRNYHSH